MVKKPLVKKTKTSLKTKSSPKHSSTRIKLSDLPNINFEESINRSPVERELKQESLRNINIIFYLSIIGLIISAYLVYVHYSGVCLDLAISNFNCAKVSTNPHAEILGINASWFALISFIIFTLSSLILRKRFSLKILEELDKFDLLDRKLFHWLNLVLAMFSFFFASYLFYVEVTVIKKMCVWCFILSLIVAAMLILALLNMSHLYDIGAEEVHTKEVLN